MLINDNDNSYSEVAIEDNDHKGEKIYKLFERKKKKSNICGNYTFVFFLLFVESLISLICFYLFYLFEFCKINLALAYNFIYIMLAIYFFIPIFILTDFYKMNKIVSNCILLVLINAFKILFGLLSHDTFVFYSNKFLNFPEFEAKAYWKFSMCLFYLLLIYYSYFMKKKDSLKFYIYVIFAIFCLSVLILLLILTQKNRNKKEIIGIYIFLSGLEIIFFLIGFYFDKYISYLYEGIKNKLNIMWEINKLEICRYHFIFILYIFYAFRLVFKCCIREYRFCQLVRRNFFL